VSNVCSAGLDVGFASLDYLQIFILGVIQGITELLPVSSTAHMRFYDQDEVSQAFWRTVLDNLPRPVQTIELEDDPQLVSYLITRAALH
jgi:hypothetical protein